VSGLVEHPRVNTLAMVCALCSPPSRARNLSALTHRSRDLVCDVRQIAHHTIGGLQHITHSFVCIVSLFVAKCLQDGADGEAQPTYVIRPDYHAKFKPREVSVLVREVVKSHLNDKKCVLATTQACSFLVLCPAVLALTRSCGSLPTNRFVLLQKNCHALPHCLSSCTPNKRCLGAGRTRICAATMHAKMGLLLWLWLACPMLMVAQFISCHMATDKTN
jgi:hypothetical protein